MTLADGWEMVVGLEVHCELKTETKLFCGCANRFGAPPNTLVCPVCLGLPGSLPVLNRRAVELAMAIGLALHSEVSPSTFHRKNYFYPDMPKDYQISQYDQPINVGGYLDLPDGSRVSIVRAHIEEDTGKTTHKGTTGRIAGAERSLVDYNRSGVPLVEIVSGPDITSSAQARAYAAELRDVLVAIGASDGKLEEGSLRFDANVSVRRPGEPLGTRCEIKNLNSLRSLGLAVEFEAARQVDLLESGGTVRQETRHWDEQRGETGTLRTKEEAEDYRYFREPDLVDLVPDAAWIGAIAARQPALPGARRATLHGLLSDVTAEQDAMIAVVASRELDDYVTAAGDAATTALARVANELAPLDDPRGRLTPAAFAETVRLETSGGLSAAQARTLRAALHAEGGEPAAVAASLGLTAVDAGEVAVAVDAALAAHPDEAARWRGGEEKLAQFFVGAVMKATKGKADGKAVMAELARRSAS